MPWANKRRRLLVALLSSCCGRHQTTTAATADLRTRSEKERRCTAATDKQVSVRDMLMQMWAGPAPRQMMSGRIGDVRRLVWRLWQHQHVGTIDLSSAVVAGHTS
uniref:Secreted protein n=1 Tax=Plectus sambesii TaxID=2011161 RepID=A0A914VQE6_9BILA